MSDAEYSHMRLKVTFGRDGSAASVLECQVEWPGILTMFPVYRLFAWRMRG